MRQFEHTKSNKIRRIQPLTRFICETLDCQEVRRLCRYYSLDPLEDFALDYLDNEVEQPDLQDSLMEEVIRDKHVSQGAHKEIIIPYMFTKEVLTDKRMAIFVYCDRVGLSQYDEDAELTFMVDIIYSIDIDKLTDYQQRCWSIAEIVSEKFDKYVMKDDKYLPIVGAVEFNLSSRIIHSKLANNTSMGVISIPIVVHTKAMRSKR